ncbi:MAG TPA: hypothetical protein EYO59_11250 [Chromatiaceae bacterium]|nr:hypothetical protein [Chromatiaceae bacterium]
MSRKSPGKRLSWRRIGLAAAVFMSIVLVGWTVWLDYQVRERFDGALWAVPAKVYARALELYVGAELSLSDVQSELAAMAYTAVRQVRQPRGG